MVPTADAVMPAMNEAIAPGIPVVCADADAPSSQRCSFIGASRRSIPCRQTWIPGALSSPGIT